jgi:hypothetical protein
MQKFSQVEVVGPRTTGYLFNFPATLFLVQSYGLYVVEARGAILSVPGLRATSRNILWSTTKENEAYARPPHVRMTKVRLSTDSPHRVVW